MSPQELHIKAIDLAEQAFLLRFKDNSAQVEKLFKEAFELEREAALLIMDEPSRSILLKSAASLAINCNELRDAEKLITLALSGEPTAEIAEELRNLYEEVNFSRHLKLRGIVLEDSTLQLVVAGKSVGYGFAEEEEVFSRVNTLKKLVYRTVERRLGRPFQERVGLAKEVKLHYQTYISEPRAASFAITVKLGKPEGQTSLWSGPQSEIIEDIVEGINLINDSQEETLKNKIQDEAYLRNFIGLTKELAPDGENVSLVGVTISREGIEKNVKLTKIKKEFNTILSKNTILTTENINKDSFIEIIGTLFYADANQNRIKIKSRQNEKYNVKVPEGLGDIVRVHFEDEVKITGLKQSKNIIHLISIDKS